MPGDDSAGVLVDKIDDPIKMPGPSENVLGSEVDILTSFDVVMQVAETVGIERLLPRSGDKATKADAAQRILKGLEVTASKGSNMISVLYRNTDPKLVMPVLEELLKRYFEKHLEVHRSVGAFDFVTRQTDKLKVELDQTEEELKQLKDKAGITSLAESTTSIASELTKGKEDLDAAEAELAAQRARVQEIEKGLAARDSKESKNETPRTSGELVQEYQSFCQDYYSSSQCAGAIRFILRTSGPEYFVYLHNDQSMDGFLDRLASAVRSGEALFEKEELAAKPD